MDRITTDTLRSSTILLVDDEPTIRDLTRRILALEGYTVLEAGDGETALELFAANTPDLVLLDVMMPGIDGIETCRRIQALPNGVTIPILIVTALEDQNTLRRAFEAGATDFITKPVQWVVMKHRIKRLLTTGKLQRTIQQQRVEEALRKSERQLREITDTMLDTVYRTNNDGIIEYASPSCWQVLGYRPEELIGKSIFSFVHPDDLDAMQKAVRTVGAAQYRCRHANGHDLWLETLSNLIFDDDSHVSGIVFASRDITERKRAEKELEDLNRLKTEFLSTAAHELRTPLTSIRGFSEILITRQLDSTRQARYLHLINEQATQLGRIIDDLLDISRLEAKRRLSLTLDIVDIAELVRAAVQPFIEASEKHTFCLEGLDAYPPVHGDAFRLTQVLKNLFSNAVKYSPKGGTIRIRLIKSGKNLVISVADPGIGMTAEQQAHLFEKFYRADASNTTISGTGLGLAISKLIVDLHGGRIWAESTYGAGSTFYLALPLTVTAPLDQKEAFHL